MSSTNRSLGLAALGWWLAARGLSEPINESFFRLDPAGVQRLGKASRLAALVAARRLAHALREEPGYGGGDLFSPNNAWLDRLDTVLNAPRVSLRLEKALTGDAEDFDALIEVGLIEDSSVMLAARLAEWLHSQVGGSDEPAALAVFLAQGWPLAPGAERRITFVQEFLANLQTELSDAPSEITAPLGAPEEFLEWLESEAGHAPATTAKALDLPPPTPPTTPAPPIEAPTDEAVAPHEEPAVSHEEPSVSHEEPSHPDEYPEDTSHEEEAHAAEVTSPAAQQSAQSVTPQVEHEIYEEAVKEHKRLRFWALFVQIGWVAAIFFGWQWYQEHRASTAKVERSATPAAAPSPSPVAKTSTPASSPRLTVHPTPATLLLSTPPPLQPEMSVVPGDLYSQALALAAAEHHAEAVALFRRIVQLQAQDKQLGRLPRALVYARMASSLAMLERMDEADASVERAQALLEELLPTHDAETALGVGMVADYWASRERWPLAARLYQKAVQAYEDTSAENSLEQLSTVNRLAGALRQIGEMTRAEQLYRQLVKAYAGAGAVVATDAASAAHNLGNVLLVTNRAGEAIRYYEEAFAWLGKASPSDEPTVKRMAVMMQASYERCLGATGIPPQEAHERALKAMSQIGKEPTKEGAR